MPAVDHVGIYITDLEAAVAFYRAGLGLDVGPIEARLQYGIRIARVIAGETELELIEGAVDRTMLATSTIAVLAPTTSGFAQTTWMPTCIGSVARGCPF